ncbi:TIGR01777 family oxidoreductase [Taibaiella soli]|uniref:TIGR01777 family protein n=1 Tax=Taibaiella soli TaxID=1649169 RepID=A0A2W2AAZ2_9BACT|nr:TIGR01777 family oxidoreductase [Taibaiella soli]PZF72555.1 TIGR01777 family protein [Taibaiella soli]
MQTIGITGGTGFVGHHLATQLQSEGYKVIIFTRSAKQTGDEQLSYAHWDPDNKKCDIAALGKADAMVHLAGASIAGKRWTPERKKEIIDSRVASTRFLVQMLQIHAPNCKTLLCASATGFYGPDRPGLTPFTEEAPAYPDFLGEVCREWEEASEEAAHFLRRVIVRFGIVLGKESGAFLEFEKPTRMGVLPILGSGQQMVCWIHVEDLARMITFLLQHDTLYGIYNGVAPVPVSNKRLMKDIGQEKGGIKIPVPVPSFVLKMMLGEMSVEVLKSTTVSAEKILRAGFSFKYPNIEKAVHDLLKKR